MENPKDLDTRVLHLTVTFRHGKPADLMAPLYQKICIGLTGKAFPKGPDRPGLVIHEDAAGSRYESAHDFNPHVHALLILPYHVDANGFDLHDIATKLNTRLNTDLRLVETRDAVVKAYDFSNRSTARSLSYIDDYNNKLVRKTNGEGFNRSLASAVYPADLDRTNPKITKAKKDRLQANYDDMLARFQTNARSIFSEPYLQAFKAELIELIQFGRLQISIAQLAANDTRKPDARRSA